MNPLEYMNTLMSVLSLALFMYSIQRIDTLDIKVDMTRQQTGRLETEYLDIVQGMKNNIDSLFSSLRSMTECITTEQIIVITKRGEIVIG